MARKKKILSAAVSVLFLALAGGCAVQTTSAPPRSPSQEARTPNVKPLDPSQAARLQRIMVPLLRAGDRTRSLKEIRLGVVEDQNINAANAGGGEFYVTTGLLQKANDEQLRGILAHEIAHDDLGHVAKAQVLGTGMNLGITRANHFPVAAPSPPSRAHWLHALTAAQKSWKRIGMPWKFCNVPATLKT